MDRTGFATLLAAPVPTQGLGHGPAVQRLPALAEPNPRSFDFGSGGNPYAGPTSDQQAALASLSANVRRTQPLFDTGVGDSLEREVLDRDFVV
jgi:hypothetical protein